MISAFGSGWPAAFAAIASTAESMEWEGGGGVKMRGSDGGGTDGGRGGTDAGRT